jgi:hypothetical protein
VVAEEVEFSVGEHHFSRLRPAPLATRMEKRARGITSAVNTAIV